MNPIIKNILAVIAGAVVGSMVNMSLIMLGHALVPPPEGIDLMNPESIAANMHLFESKHFIFPLIAHAAGTLVGAMLAYKIAASHKMQMAFVVGGLFLIGGIVNVFSLNAPMWFNVVDLIAAYIPMAWLANRFMSKS